MENYPLYYHYNPNHNNHPYSSSLTPLLIIPSSSPSLSPSSSSSKTQNHHYLDNNNGGKKGPPKLSTDPQSVAARERRHRISDRFKILQTLVPGGAKLDTVSLLEQAIQYVKFLKAQIWLHQAIINPKHVNMEDHDNDNNAHHHDGGDYDCYYCVNDAKANGFCPSYDILHDDDDALYYDESYSYYSLMHGKDGANHHQGESSNIIGASQTAATGIPDFSVGYQTVEGNYDQEGLYYKRSINYY